MPYHWRRFCVLWNCCLYRLVLFTARIILKLNLSADPWRGPGPLPLPISSFETQPWTNYCPIHFFPRIFCLTIFKASLCSPNTFLTTCKLKVKTLIFSTNCTPRPQQFSVTTFISSWHKLLITLGDVPYKLDLKWKSLNTLTYCPFTLPLFGYSWSNFISNNKIVVIWVIIQWWFFICFVIKIFPWN